MNQDKPTLDATIPPLFFLFLAQLVTAGLCHLLFSLTAMGIAGCASACDYEGVALASNVMTWSLIAITALHLGTLVVFHRRGWRNWIVLAASVLLTIAALLIATRLAQTALGHLPAG